jgi:flagellar basal-body rod protein FlgG
MCIQSLYTSAAGMTSMESKLDVIANNLANMETTAFKCDRCNFEDMFYVHEKLPGALDQAGQYTPVGIALGTGSRVQSVQTHQTQGTLENTGRALDVAIEGQGYFQITDTNGQTLYTRAGNLNINPSGSLVMGSASTGRLLYPAISVPTDATAIQISDQGIVSVLQPGNQQMTQIGQVQLATFVDPEGLLKLGENLYAQTDASGTPRVANPGVDGMGQLHQGSLESSNVEPVQQLIDLITTQRAFELNAQVIQAGDQILQTVGTLRRY